MSAFQIVRPSASPVGRTVTWLSRPRSPRSRCRSRPSACVPLPRDQQRPARTGPHRGRHRPARRRDQASGRRGLRPEEAAQVAGARRRALLRLLRVPVPGHGLPRGVRPFSCSSPATPSSAIPLVGHWACSASPQDFIAMLASSASSPSSHPVEEPARRTSAASPASSAPTSAGAASSLFMIFNVIWTMFLFRGASAALGNLPYEHGRVRLASASARLLDGLGHERPRGARGHRPAAAHRRDARLPDLRAQLQHLHIFLAPLNVMFGGSRSPSAPPSR